MAKHTVATLRKPATAVGPPYRFDGEANLHHAFRQLKLVAEALAATKYHHDALTNIYLSIECFLKYLYCLVREQEVPASFYLTSMTKSVGEQLGAKDRFGHDLRAMTLVLSAHTDLSNFREYLNLERSLPAGTAW